MKLEKLFLENFKCFQNTELEFGKITILTGANSSGKSSILYSLLGSLQGGGFPFELSINGKYVNMGDFKSLVFKHFDTKKVKIGFNFNSGDSKIEIVTTWFKDPKRQIPTLFELRVKSDYYNLSIIRKEKYYLQWEYDKEKDPGKDFYKYEFQKKFNKLLKEYLGDDTILEQFKDAAGNLEFEFDDFDELFDTEKGRADLYLFKELGAIIDIFRHYDVDTNFISSFRHSPERTYYEKSLSDLKVEKDGSKYIDQIVLWETNKDKEFKSLSKILNELTILNSIRSKRFEGGRFEVQVKVNKDSVLSTLNDVGFGINQLLPILVADLQLSDDSSLFIAQPEIHLHPEIQAQLGEYFVKSASKSNKSYILETHSEYILNRIRLSISKGKIASDSIKVYYFINNGVESKTYPIKFLKNGKIEGAPKEFFETYMMDVMNIALSSTQ